MLQTTNSPLDFSMCTWEEQEIC